MSRSLEMTKKYIDLLDPKELKQIQAYLQLKTPTKPSTEFSEEEEILVRRLIHFVSSKKLGRLTEKSITANKGLKTLIKEASSSCFMIVPKNMDLPRIERLHDLILNLALKDLNTWAETSVHGIVNTCKKAGLLIENSFPGYIGSNMLPFLLNNRGQAV